MPVARSVSSLEESACLLYTSVGGSGAGKSRTYAIPNIMQCNCSMVITDPKGELLRKTGGVLERNGYCLLYTSYPEEYAEGENWRILHGDKLKLVKAFQPGIFDAVITDPPYASGGTKPVSYTHLDVYKRQLQDMRCL